MKQDGYRPDGHSRRTNWRRMLVTGRAYLMLSACSTLLFVFLGLGGMLQKSLSTSPVQSMQGLAASLSARLFESLLGMELPHMESPEKSPLQAGRMAAFLLRFMTNVNPDDPRSLLASEMPLMDRDRSVLLRPGSGGDEAPEDSGPLGTQELQPDDPGQSGETGIDEPEPSEGHADDAPEPDKGQAEPDKPDAEGPRTTQGDKVVFIYHSHNRESWYPELKSSQKDPNSDKINVTLVGKRLAKQLEARGVGASQSSKDYPTTVEGYNWNYSYKYSLKTVKEALAANDRLQFFFDIHRDSQRRNKTTATIGDKDYAQVYFIIGHKNPDWRENESFANRIHELLEKDYPGLSRGVWGKTAANGNGEYNQSVAPDSVLIEIGGVDNTLQESYRTADVLAKAISQIYWEEQDATKADAPANPSGKKG
ncbi:stage II sporulation protein P [Cohnella suwonensis]|uniref:Stage II sporulation protein P n=1 Tax=Cohnella suwonensis TaxID=696072 RepID=A0ABW0M3Y3_9BACL